MYSFPAGSNHQKTEDDEIDLAALLRVLWRGKWIIAIFTLLAVLAGGYYAIVAATPLYKSTAVVMLESREEQVLDLESVIGGLSGDTSVVNSEVEVLRSRNLMRKVVEKLQLTNDAEFNPQLRSPDLLAQVREFLGIAPVSQALPAEIQKQRTLDATIDTLLKQVTVQNIRQSLVFRITAVTGSAGKSAKIADTIVELYILNQLEVKFEATEQATIWLTDRLVQLQAELEAAEKKLTDFSAGTDLISVEKLQALERQLKELRERITGARTSVTETSGKATVLMNAQGRDAQAIATGDPQLARFLKQLTDNNNLSMGQAFDTRFAQLLARAQLEASRAENQLNALANSQADLESQTLSQGQDLITLQQLTREAEASRLLYEYFLGRLKETSAQQGIQQADSRVLSNAVVPRSPSSPRIPLLLAISAVLGLMAGVGIVLIRELGKNTFRTAQDMEKYTGYTVMGQVPLIPARTRKEAATYLAAKPSSAAAEAIRNLRTSILLSNVDSPPQIIATTSALPAEGKTTVSFALAQNLVGMQKKVLLIEGDIRRRTFGQYLDNPNGKGILAVLSGTETLENAVFQDKLTGADILLGEGSNTNAADIFSSKRFSTFLKDARDKYDIIIIDTPPVLVVPDARIIAQLTDAILFIVKWDSTSKNQVEEGLHMFETVNLKVAGLVLTQISSKGMKRYGHGENYGAYSTYGKSYYIS